MAYHRGITHAVAVFQIARQGDADDLHIIMRVRTESHAGSYGIIIQYPQGTKVYLVRIIVTCKTETMIRIQPAVLGMSLSLAGCRIICPLAVSIKSVFMKR